jgi:hypothetical protein
MFVIAGVALVKALRSPTAPTPDYLTVPHASVDPVAFDYAPLNRVLHRFVNGVGLVDYTGLKRDPADLDAFLAEVEKVSPHSNLATFMTRDEALAYWINAYNAWALKTVLDAYPVKSILDIDGGKVFDREGLLCGGDKLSLNDIESGIVRREFADPRVHFTLNCASWSCPRLPREAFDPKRLDAQLDRETRRFFADPTHLRVDVANRTVHLSTICQWYEEDFAKWLAKNGPAGQTKVLAFVKLYAPVATEAKIRPDFRVDYLTYDWRLSDQHAPWARERTR